MSIESLTKKFSRHSKKEILQISATEPVQEKISELPKEKISSTGYTIPVCEECSQSEFWFDYFKKSRCRFCCPAPSPSMIAFEEFWDDGMNRWLVTQGYDEEENKIEIFERDPRSIKKRHSEW